MTDYTAEGEHMRGCGHPVLLFLDDAEIGVPFWICTDCGAIVARPATVTASASTTEVYAWSLA